MRQMLVVVSASLILLASCGDSEGGSEEGDGGRDRESTTTTDEGGSDGEATDAAADEYVQAISGNISSEEGAALDEEASTCLATAIVDLVSVDALHEAGVSPEELADAESLADVDVDAPDDAPDRLGDEFVACNVGEQLATALVEGVTGGAGGGLSAEAGTCVREHMDPDGLAHALAVSFLDGSDDDFQGVMGDAFADCPDALTSLIIAQAPAEVSEEGRACVRSVVEENSATVEAAVIDNDEDASNELADILSDACPDVVGG